MDIITSHFEYHSIDHNLLKLDILGHDDPTMIRLEDLTGLDPTKIRLDDKAVMALFQSTSAGDTPEDIDGIPLGSLGVPEFGTDFAMGMLLDAKPQGFLISFVSRDYHTVPMYGWAMRRLYRVRHSYHFDRHLYSRRYYGLSDSHGT